MQYFCKMSSTVLGAMDKKTDKIHLLQSLHTANVEDDLQELFNYY